MITFVKDRDTTLAIILGHGHHGDGIEFFTPNEFSQQLAYMNRPRGYVDSSARA